jgi:hypothetical protein
MTTVVKMFLWAVGIVIGFVICAIVWVTFFRKNNGEGTRGTLTDSEKRNYNLSSGGSTKYPPPVPDQAITGTICTDHHGKKVDWNKSQKIVRRDKGEINNAYFSRHKHWSGLEGQGYDIKEYKCQTPKRYDINGKLGNAKYGEGIGNRPSIKRDEKDPKKRYITNGFNYMNCPGRKVTMRLIPEIPIDEWPDESNMMARMNYNYQFVCADADDSTPLLPEDTPFRRPPWGTDDASYDWRDGCKSYNNC